MVPGSAAVKLFILFRDCLTLTGIVLIFNFLKKYKYVYLLSLLLLYVLLRVFYWDTLNESFDIQLSSNNSVMRSDVAMIYSEDGELLVQFGVNSSPADIQEFLNKYSIDYSPAFTPQFIHITDLDQFYLFNVPKNYILFILFIIFLLFYFYFT